MVRLRLYWRQVLVRERLSLIVGLRDWRLARELYRGVLYGGWGAGLELHVCQHSVDQLDVMALVGHEVAALWVGVGDHVLVGEEGVHVAAVGGRGRDLQAL